MTKRGAKTGKREDLPHFTRSSWEANISRLYRWKGTPYEYEPKTFYFEGVRRGAIHYTPDFYLPNEGVYIEVKGQMTSVDRTKLKRMKKFYPHITVVVLGKEEYEELEKTYGHQVPNWEFPKKKERNAHKEKVEKSLSELEKEGYMTTLVDWPGVDIIATDGTSFRAIKVVYTTGEDSHPSHLLDDMSIEKESSISREVWVFTYGHRGYQIIQ